MALRDKLRERVQPALDPGEQIEHVFMARTGPNPLLGLITWLILFRTKYFLIAVTDRRIAVFDTGRMSGTKPRNLVASFPRDTHLGGAPGGLWGKIDLGGVRYWVNRRFRADVQAADAAAIST